MVILRSNLATKHGIRHFERRKDLQTTLQLFLICPEAVAVSAAEGC